MIKLSENATANIFPDGYYGDEYLKVMRSITDVNSNLAN